MSKVFVGGSRKLSRFNEMIRERLDGIISSGHQVLVGDANGADRPAQKHFAEAGYRDVIVYFSGDAPRNNLSNWPTHGVESKSKRKDFEFFMAKDLAMAEEADFGFMLWDGESKGTLNNVLNLLERDKKVVVYFSPGRESRTLRQVADVIPLMEHCSKAVLEGFESKIDFSSRIAQPQFRVKLD